MVSPFGFFIEHIPLLNMTIYPALSNRLIEISVNAILGACIVPLKTVFVLLDPLGRSMCILSIPTAFTVHPSAVVILWSISL